MYIDIYKLNKLYKFYNPNIFLSILIQISNFTYFFILASILYTFMLIILYFITRILLLYHLYIIPI